MENTSEEVPPPAKRIKTELEEVANNDSTNNGQKKGMEAPKTTSLINEVSVLSETPVAQTSAEQQNETQANAATELVEAAQTSSGATLPCTNDEQHNASSTEATMQGAAAAQVKTVMQTAKSSKTAAPEKQYNLMPAETRVKTEVTDDERSTANGATSNNAETNATEANVENVENAQTSDQPNQSSVDTNDLPTVQIKAETQLLETIDECMRELANGSKDAEYLAEPQAASSDIPAAATVTQQTESLEESAASSDIPAAATVTQQTAANTNTTAESLEERAASSNVAVAANILSAAVDDNATSNLPAVRIKAEKNLEQTTSESVNDTLGKDSSPTEFSAKDVAASSNVATVATGTEQAAGMESLAEKVAATANNSDQLSKPTNVPLLRVKTEPALLAATQSFTTTTDESIEISVATETASNSAQVAHVAITTEVPRLRIKTEPELLAAAAPTKAVSVDAEAVSVDAEASTTNTAAAQLADGLATPFRLRVKAQPELLERNRAAQLPDGLSTPLMNPLRIKNAAELMAPPPPAQLPSDVLPSSSLAIKANSIDSGLKTPMRLTTALNESKHRPMLRIKSEAELQEAIDTELPDSFFADILGSPGELEKSPQRRKSIDNPDDDFFNDLLDVKKEPTDAMSASSIVPKAKETDDKSRKRQRKKSKKKKRDEKEDLENDGETKRRRRSSPTADNMPEGMQTPLPPGVVTPLPPSIPEGIATPLPIARRSIKLEAERRQQQNEREEVPYVSAFDSLMKLAQFTPVTVPLPRSGFYSPQKRVNRAVNTHNNVALEIDSLPVQTNAARDRAVVVKSESNKDDDEVMITSNPEIRLQYASNRVKSSITTLDMTKDYTGASYSAKCTHTPAICKLTNSRLNSNLANSSPLHRVHNVSYAFNSLGAQFNLSQWGLKSISKRMMKYCRVLGCDAEKLNAACNVLKGKQQFFRSSQDNSNADDDDDEQHQQSQKAFYLHVGTQTTAVKIIDYQQMHEVGLQTHSITTSTATQTSVRVSDAPSNSNAGMYNGGNNSHLPLFRKLPTLSEDMLLGLNDMLELMEEPREQSAADTYRLRTQLLEIFKAATAANNATSKRPAQMMSDDDCPPPPPISRNPPPPLPSLPTTNNRNLSNVSTQAHATDMHASLRDVVAPQATTNDNAWQIASNIRTNTQTQLLQHAQQHQQHMRVQPTAQHQQHLREQQKQMHLKEQQQQQQKQQQHLREQQKQMHLKEQHQRQQQQQRQQQHQQQQQQQQQQHRGAPQTYRQHKEQQLQELLSAQSQQRFSQGPRIVSATSIPMLPEQQGSTLMHSFAAPQTSRSAAAAMNNPNQAASHQMRPVQSNHRQNLMMPHGRNPSPPSNLRRN